MITAMRAIAAYLDNTEVSDILSKVMTLHQKIDKVIVLSVRKVDGEYHYEYSFIVDYDPIRSTQYLYRQGPSNGPGTTPAALITDVEKTLPQKMLAWFKRVPDLGNDTLEKGEIEVITAIGNALENEKEKIISDVNSHLITIDRSGGNTLLTIQIDDDGEKKYIGQMDEFVTLFLELVKQRYYKKYGTTSKGHGICYVCNNENEVYGFMTDVFSFYTLDKRGFAPQLDVSEGWKSFPVCFDCAVALETAKQFLDDNLLFNFYGARYYLIPQSVTESEESLGEMLSVFSEQDRKLTMADESGRLTDDEGDILEFISSLSDSIVLNFLFFIMEQSSMRILGFMEDVLPSRIARVFEIKRYLENKGLYYESAITFNFCILRDILAMGRDAKDYKEFIYVTGRILKDQLVEQGLLLNRILTYLEKHRNEWGIGSLMGSTSSSTQRKRMDSVLRCMMLLEFFVTSQDQEVGETQKMSDTNEITREEIVGKIFEHHPHFFKTHTQKSAFLIGLLTGRLMAIQGHRRGSAPFEKKLHNLRFTMKRLKRLYLQVEAKLKAYGHSGTYSGLEQMLASELLNAADEDVDDDDLSLSFVIGLNQSYKLKSTKGDETT